MKLSLEQIRSITKGAVRVEEQNGMISFFRFTQKQEEVYRLRSADFYQKTFATSGIRLEFITDSRSLFFSVEVTSGSSRKFFAHDILVNGKKIGTLGSDNTNTGKFSETFDLGDGEKNVCIYFPWSAASKLIAMELDDNSKLSPIPKSRKMLIYGDSITQGYDAENPSRSYAARLTDALDAEAFNKAIGGEVFYAPHAEASEDGDFDIITVAYGTNDHCKVSFESFEKNAIEFYRTLSKKYPSAQIFAIAPIWRLGYENDTAFGNFFLVRDTIARIISELKNVVFVDAFDFVPKDSAYFADLRLHPNNKGFDFYADALIAEIQKHL